jgi:hypothetical protein
MAKGKWQMAKNNKPTCYRPSTICHAVCFWAIFLLPYAMPFPVLADEAALLKQVQLLNQIPEEQLNEKADPCFSIMRSIYDQDGPDFLTLRSLLGQPSVRSQLNPSARCVLGNVISQRWDTFALSGILYLSGLQSKNPDLRDKARKKIACFIQPMHIPALIDLLRIPGPNVLAYDVLQEVTGQHMDPSVKAWQAWWRKKGGKVDIVGHLLNDTRNQLKQYVIHPIDQEQFWYAPVGIDDVQVRLKRRAPEEQSKLSDWNGWAENDVKRYTEDWAAVKPILDRMVHQPDPRVNKYLEYLVADPGYGDYASVVLAWRSSASSLSAIQAAYLSQPTVGRALARGSLGDKTALVDLLRILEKHQMQPMGFKVMEDDTRTLMTPLRTVGVVSAEQAFALLCHQDFGFESANTSKEKKRTFKEAKSWLEKNVAHLAIDRRRGYFTVSSNP